MKTAAVLGLFLSWTAALFAFVGKMTDVTGPTQIVRGSNKIEGKKDGGIDMADSVETLKARVSITFEDDTKMQVTEFSKLKIDEFVYDPKSGKGSLSVKAAFGTVRYASGAIAKNSRETVKIQTPTAKVSVRGTDFSMTVSEDGKSLIILLPSVPLSSGIPPVVGSIEVSNLGGSVLMTQAYQATFISSQNSAPTIPVILDFQDESKINNMLIVETPKQVTQAVKEQKKEKQQSQSADEDDKPKKKDSKSSNSQANTPSNAQAVASQSGSEDQDSGEVQTELSLEALQPEVLKEVANAIQKTVQPVTFTFPTSVTNNPSWSTDGTNATLRLDSSGNIIQYKTKANMSLTVEVTNSEGTKQYPLNFGDKSRVNIIQKR
jgi:hypothetical protein